MRFCNIANGFIVIDEMKRIDFFIFFWYVLKVPFYYFKSGYYSLYTYLKNL